MGTVDAAGDALLDGVRRLAADAGPVPVLAGLGSAFADALGVDAVADRPALLDGASEPVPDDLVPAVRTVADGGAAPDVMGQAAEAVVDRRGRRAGGVHHTQPAVADGIVRLATTAAAGRTPASVSDPAVGGGAFLLAAARSLRESGIPPAEVLDRLWGCDLDSTAVSVAEVALWLWAAEAGSAALPPPGRLVVDDGLLASPATWADPPPTGFDLVVGNPPFGNQLETATARSAARRRQLVARFGEAAGGYVDTAALFLLACCNLARWGGVVALVQPQSVLAARDAAPVRAELGERARLAGTWTDGERVFDAEVDVCALVLEVGGDTGDRSLVVRAQGPTFERAPDAEPPGSEGAAGSWAPLLARADDPPLGRIDDAGRLGDLCEATAGFRRQFYGLVGAVDEASSAPTGSGEDGRPLVTCGLIHPGTCLWSRRPARFAGRRWQAPLVRPERIGDLDVQRWVADRLRPKVLLATQTKVLEAFADHHGRTVPSTPVIELTSPPDRLDHVVAVLLAPPATAWALRRYRGAALSADAIKLSARQVLDVPLPARSDRWEAGAALVPEVAAAAAGADDASWRRSLVELGTVMCEAYGAEPDGLVDWWAARLPKMPTTVVPVGLG